MVDARGALEDPVELEGVRLFSWCMALVQWLETCWTSMWLGSELGAAAGCVAESGWHMAAFPATKAVSCCFVVVACYEGQRLLLW